MDFTSGSDLPSCALTAVVAIIWEVFVGLSNRRLWLVSSGVGQLGWAYRGRGVVGYLCGMAGPDIAK